MADRYTLLKPLGEGGMGRVVLARDSETGREIALKFLSATLDPEARALFKEEVSLLSRLSHPNLVRVLDYHDEKEPFFAMEFVDGPMLPEAVKDADEARVLDLFVQSCRGLHYIHSRNVFHRDLKPSNLLVDASGVLKILDFGIARVGTPAYTAPESRMGAYDQRSDLYSLGVLWREVLGARKLPAFFSDLLDRLRSPDPNARPASALALVKYLNRHVAKPFPLTPEETQATVLDKPAWVERPEEKEFWSWVETASKKKTPSLLRIAGPTGVGRTRFLEEMKWRLQLKGRPFSFAAALADLRREGEKILAASDLAALAFVDLHEAPAEFLQQAQILLRRLARRTIPHLLLLEYDEDLAPPALKTFLAYADTWKAPTLTLRDLDDDRSRRLIRNASLEERIDPERERRILDASGGRPLLLLEFLRQGEAAVPKSLAQAARFAVESLPRGAQRLLALVVSHSEEPSHDDLARLCADGDSLHDAEIVLHARGLLDPSSLVGPHARLRHPSLKASYRDALPTDLVAAAHAAWVVMLKRACGGQPLACAPAITVVEHALAIGDKADALEWGKKAVEFLFQNAKWSWVLELCERILPLAAAPLDRAVFLGHAAPVYYRLGRYEEAMKAYDLWYANKPDDGTGVETVKHRLYTGLTELALGRKDRAAARFHECLKNGDSKTHERHRGYHARAHLLLASLETEAAAAGVHLEASLKLAEGQTMLLGEIEHQYGELERSRHETAKALERFRRSAAHYASAGNPQAEAIAKNSIAMTLRQMGRLPEAFAEIQSALGLALKGGETLQIARYRQNLALTLMDLGRYGEASEAMDRSRDAIEQMGEDLDRSLVAKYRDELETFLGRRGPDALARLKASLRQSYAPSRPDTSRPEEALEAIRAVPAPEARADLYAECADILGKKGLKAVALSFANAARLEWDSIRRQLPEELKMDFDKRPDLQQINKTLEELLPKTGGAVHPAPAVRGQISASRFRQFCAINRQIAAKNGSAEILERVIDAAIEITGAERGFILLKDPKAAKSPVPGFDVRVARNLNREALKQDDFGLSLSFVKQAIDKGAYVLSDDALSDPRFQEKKSVMQHRLRSILAVPLEEDGQVFGAVYLDHRYQPGCFTEEDLALVNALAGQASLAIQKARLIEELKASRDKLAVEVKDQAVKIETLSEELTKKRGQLRYGYEDIIGQSPSMLKVFQVLDDVTETSIPVWIHGESGTGKELIARSLHYNSPRAKGAFVAENVSAIPETLLESELFGHKKGSFTHADRDRVGLFEQASGGTLFLDEIADMSLAMQAKLLRVLQEGEVRPVGSGKKVKIDVRLVTASNRDLSRLVQDGKFRQDLFFRINGLTIGLPPLRSRKEDIPLLVRHFTKSIAKEFNLPASDPTDKALKALLAHNWPGNVRELEAVLRNALLFAKGKPITPDHLTIKSSSMAASMDSSASSPAAAPSPEDAAQRDLVVGTLRKHHLSKDAAAQELGVSLRTLYTWMEKYGIPKKKAMLARFVDGV